MVPTVVIVTLSVVVVLLYLMLCYKSTIGICKCSKHLVGKVVIVAGADRGIGFETAKDLAERGARVIITSNDEELGLDARSRLVQLTANDDIHFHFLDLSSFRSITEFANDITQKEKRLDALVNNAGVLVSSNKQTEDGLLEGMQINYFGPLLLSLLLLPLLKISSPSRIINVASSIYRFGNLELDEFKIIDGKKYFNYIDVYKNSKLCVVMGTIEMARRLEGTGVTVNCLHPGMVDTNIAHIEDCNAVLRYILSHIKAHVKSPWEGAQTTIYLAVSDEVSKVSGCYYSDCKKTNTISFVQDKELGRRLWDLSVHILKSKSMSNHNDTSKLSKVIFGNQFDLLH